MKEVDLLAKDKRAWLYSDPLRTEYSLYPEIE